jgi:hypothetical protein
MSMIVKRIGELLGFKQPKQAVMEKMADMEHMPAPGQMAAMEPMPEPGKMMEMEHMPEPGQMADMGQMTHIEQQEHQPNDMAAMPGAMKPTQVQPDRHTEMK